MSDAELHKLGIPQLDRQHAEIITLITAIREACTTGAPLWAVTRMVDELQAQLSNHVECEENAMRKDGYPFLNEHVRIHTEMLTLLRALCNTLRSGTQVSDSEILETVDDWERHHIREVDAEYGLWLRTRNVV